MIVGLAVSGWQEAPGFWDKTDFIVVVIGIPIIIAVLVTGWYIVRPNVVANTGGKIESVWTDHGPRYDDADLPDVLEDKTITQ